MTRKPSVSRLLAKRAAEDEKLSAALVEMKEQRAALDARICEVEQLLNVGGATTRVGGRSQMTEGHVRCADCGISVPKPANAGERSSEGPACRASPFEETDGTMQ